MPVIDGESSPTTFRPWPRRLLEKLWSNVEVIRFDWYLDILESRLYKYASESRLNTFIKKANNRISRILTRVTSVGGYHPPRVDKQDSLKKVATIENSSSAKQLSKKILKSEEQHVVLSHLPIVFMHYGNSDYLKYSLRQAKNSNPGSTVYLLGDSLNDCYEGIEHHPFMDYFVAAEGFSKVYRHYNTTPYHYALFDFQRWFILKEFLCSNRLQKCLYLDSDTMLYADVTKEQERFSQFDFTLSLMLCGNTFFLNRLSALEDFCQFLMDIYMKNDRYHYDKLVAHFALRKRNGLKGGACDMTALQLFLLNHFDRIGEVAKVIDGAVYDPNINLAAPGFEMSNGIKRVFWKNTDPYGIYLRTGEQVRFSSLHFQGGNAKRLISQFYRG